MDYCKISNKNNLKQNLEKVLHKEGPLICEIMGREDQNYISMSHVKNANGKFVVRPLEDQAPFLERELFLSEMLIDPIDQ